MTWSPKERDHQKMGLVNTKDKLFGKHRNNLVNTRTEVEHRARLTKIQS